MSISHRGVCFGLSAIALAVHGLAHAQAPQPDPSSQVLLPETTVRATAEQELKQALGVSVITEEDLSKRPPANDLSELIRTMPGVNLTGNSASGQFGNSRQIDLRGMGPENTLILIDGKPVQSRNASKMGRTGERDTRGDSNWVPVEAIESIEVIRGPAAARYGSGAAGGVVNIITKKPTDKLSGSVTVYGQKAEHSEEGDTKRASFNLSGPVAENLSFRLYGNIAKTDADDTSLNSHVSELELPPAGREGVRNRDLNAMLRWDLTPQQVLELEAGTSRQGNIYAGERLMNSDTNADNMQALLGQETNITHRNTLGLTHRGKWDWGTSRLLFQAENTRRSQYPVGLAGGPEGSITSTDPGSMVTSRLANYFLNGEVNTPLTIGSQRHMLTSGFEYRNERLNDPGANAQSSTSSAGDDISDLTGSSGTRSGKSDSQTWAFYVEDNFEPVKNLVLTPGMRFDHHSQAGSNWSPSLNATYHLTDQWSVKGGVARAFKAPNLYQTNINYLYYTRGNGCPLNSPNMGGGCYIRGNPDLKPETSINKELGVAFSNHEGLDASLSYFQNDYKNKIYAEMNDGSSAVVGTTQVFQWMNASRAVVRGFEGNLTLPLLGNGGDTLKWVNNFTYMLKNHNKDNNQPLSVIPKYTVNSTLDWRISPAWSTQFFGTFYGRQEPRTINTGGSAATGAQLTELGSYAVFGVGAKYQIKRALTLGFGVNNIGDKRLFRTASNSAGGAATYNEPGRSYYLSLTSQF
ncbi:FepA family TonB-dependent siderophore receptor [Diaphorobacter ruginosibacter]|uniref:FepA family TonB-dependent siderophore receptor n=1 Tax=Diaphorobacter ruginosibacter TaxID=1715720 RepID=UPI00333F5EB1